MRTTVCITGAIILMFLMVYSADSQVVNRWPGVAPGSENWTDKERVAENRPIGTEVFNVVTPTLTACLPEQTKATGTASSSPRAALAIDLQSNEEM